MYNQATAADLNKHMCQTLFGSENANVTLIKPWGYECKTAKQYMKKNGIGVIQRSIQAFLNGDVLHHTGVCSSNNTGLLVADQHLLATLQFLASSPNDNICYKQLQHAVKKNILKPAILDILPTKSKPQVVTRTNTMPPIRNQQKTDNAENMLHDTNPDVEFKGSDMLVDDTTAKTQTEDRAEKMIVDTEMDADTVVTEQTTAETPTVKEKNLEVRSRKRRKR
tara:strand:+ start:10738 stop:11406 length:669 start_codon:yes stop_codon:yes gene_type:complete